MKGKARIYAALRNVAITGGKTEALWHVQGVGWEGSAQSSVGKAAGWPPLLAPGGQGWGGGQLGASQEEGLPGGHTETVSTGMGTDPKPSHLTKRKNVAEINTESAKAQLDGSAGKEPTCWCR